ncbi:FAD/NAD(P)-binding protein [Nocardia terpenica]|uniref:FAD/NAD(P)-binding protein n=1 Tax=Nocardia terpenica TaxID=455432 RepID=UPI002FDF74FA
MDSSTTTVCIVGLGPRGLSVFERLCANARDLLGPGARLHIHLVDPHLGRGSRVWRTDQPPQLLMNTVAAQITMFVDESVSCAGPIVPGPSLYEWARFIALVDPFPGLPGHVRAEAATLGPDTYPTRAFYGHYLAWVLRHLTDTAPADIAITPHCRTAIDVADDDEGRQTVTLADGTTLPGLDAVILTLGHTGTRPTDRERALADFAGRHDLLYVPPGNPADVDVDRLAPGQPTALRGLGLNFFDYMALLTTGRGGNFTRGSDGRLRYERSGLEPILIAGSRRGVPYQARGENQKGPHGRHTPLFFTAPVIDRMRRRADRGEPVAFDADVWPIIDREVRAVYYSTLIADRRCRCDADAFLRSYVANAELSGHPRSSNPLSHHESPAETALLERFGISAAQRWDWQRIAYPYDERSLTGVAEFRSWLLDYLERDVRAARRGNVDGPLKAALDVLRDLRNEIRLVVDHGGLGGDSYRDELQRWYTPFNGFLSIGPPASRIEEMIALIEAGVLTVVGPDVRIECPDDGDGFRIRSPAIPGSVFRATALIEARLPDTDIRRTTDPLLRRLLARGECAPHRIPIRGGGYYETGGLAVTQRPYHVLDGNRRPHPRRFAFGVPTETVHWVTAAGIRPGVDSVILGDADSVARAGLTAARLGASALSTG